MTWLTAMEYLCHNDHRYVPLVVNTSRLFPYSWLITGFVTGLTRQLPLVEQQLLPFLSSPQVFSRVRVTRYLVLCVCFVDRCLSLCPYSFGHCVVCSSNYLLWNHDLYRVLQQNTYLPKILPSSNVISYRLAFIWVQQVICECATINRMFVFTYLGHALAEPISI